MANLDIITKDDTLVVDSRLIAEELGIEHRGLMQTIKKHQSVIEQGFGVITFEMLKPLEGSRGGRPENIAYLTEDQATLLMTFSRNTEQVINCKVNLVKAFSQAKRKISQPSFEIPQTRSETLRLAADLAEENKKLEAEKALLEAENHQLSEALDDLFNYSSIVRVAKFNKAHESIFSWRSLKSTSIQMGIEIKKVPDARYETKNLYSHDVWRVAYPGVKLPETTTLVINKICKDDDEDIPEIIPPDYAEDIISRIKIPGSQDLFLQQSQLLGFEDGMAIIEMPSKSFVNFVSAGRHKKELEQAFSEHYGRPINVFLVARPYGTTNRTTPHHDR